jgi:hypothetical protein
LVSQSHAFISWEFVEEEAETIEAARPPIVRTSQCGRRPARQPITIDRRDSRQKNTTDRRTQQTEEHNRQKNTTDRRTQQTEEHNRPQEVQSFSNRLGNPSGFVGIYATSAHRVMFRCITSLLAALLYFYMTDGYSM